MLLPRKRVFELLELQGCVVNRKRISAWMANGFGPPCTIEGEGSRRRAFYREEDVQGWADKYNVEELVTNRKADSGLQVDLDTDLADRLRAVAKKEMVTVQSLARLAIQYWLADIEEAQKCED